MTKRHNSNPHERPKTVAIERRERRAELAPLPDAQSKPLLSERAYLRATSVAQDQRERRARYEALALLERDRQARDAKAFALPTTVSEDLQAVRRRPLDAPMATYPDDAAAFPTASAEPLAWAMKGYGFALSEIPSFGIARFLGGCVLLLISFLAGFLTGNGGWR